MTRHRRQHGFALVLVLVLLMIAAIALAAAARQSATEALASRDATEALQRRWAVTSCRATLLPRAAGLMDSAAQQGQADADGVPVPGAVGTQPSAQRWVSCTLAGIAYDLVLTDEQAKYNPTLMQQLSAERSVRSALRNLSDTGSRGSADGQTRVLLRPMIGLNPDGTLAEPDENTGELIEVYAGYGQLFDQVSAQALLGGKDAPGPAARVTCWGDGKLNIANASDRVVRQTLGPVLGSEGVDAMLKERHNAPGVGPERWLKQVPNLSADDRALAQFMLTQTSKCQGLWVVARGKTRSWYTFSVREFKPVPEIEPQDAQGLDTLSAANKTDVKGGDEEQDQPVRAPLQRYDFAW